MKPDSWFKIIRRLLDSGFGDATSVISLYNKESRTEVIIQLGVNITRHFNLILYNPKLIKKFNETDNKISHLLFTKRLIILNLSHL